MNKKLATLIGMVVLALALFGVAANPAAAQNGINDIWSAVLMHSTLRVQGAVTHDSTLTQTGAATFVGTLNPSGTFTTSGLVGAGIQTQALAPVGGVGAAQTYTFTQSLVQLTPSAAVTLALGLIGNGYVLRITNNNNFTVLFPDSGNQDLGGARSLTQYDVLTVVQVGGKWREVSMVAN